MLAVQCYNSCLDVAEVLVNLLDVAEVHASFSRERDL